jgi:hypothetical protein
VTIKASDLMQVYLPLGTKQPNTYVCLNPKCEAISWDFEMKVIFEPHGERTLVCPVCGCGELE